MTYVSEQTPAELRDHMRRLQNMPNWNDRLADRLWLEVQSLEDQLRAAQADRDKYRQLWMNAVAPLAIRPGHQ